MNLPTTSLVCGLAIAAWAAVPGPAAGAEPPVPKPADFHISEVKATTHSAPDYGASTAALGNRGQWANQRWLVIDVEFETESEWLDDVQLKFYALLGVERDRRMLTGDLNLVNLRKGRHHYAAMFIHPSTLERFGRKPEAVAVVLLHLGRQMVWAGEPKNAPVRWWENYSPVPGFLLRPADSPWAAVAHERYDPVKTGPVNPTDPAGPVSPRPAC